MSNTTKPTSDFDQTLIMQKVYNPADGTLATGTFLQGQLGNKIVAGYPDSSTETYSFYEGTHLLYVYTVIYTDSTKSVLTSVERTT